MYLCTVFQTVVNQMHAIDSTLHSTFPTTNKSGSVTQTSKAEHHVSILPLILGDHLYQVSQDLRELPEKNTNTGVWITVAIQTDWGFMLQWENYAIAT